jgi:hypothetical protein
MAPPPFSSPRIVDLGPRSRNKRTEHGWVVAILTANGECLGARAGLGNCIIASSGTFDPYLRLIEEVVDPDQVHQNLDGTKAARSGGLISSARQEKSKYVLSNAANPATEFAIPSSTYSKRTGVVTPQNVWSRNIQVS